LTTISTTTFDAITSPTLEVAYAAATEIANGISLLSSSGGISSSTGSLATSLLSKAVGTPSGSPYFRFELINLGIGISK
jgi:hypothetical protein